MSRPSPGLVGVHLKSFRTNLGDVVPGLVAVADGVAAAGGRLEVDVHTEVADDPRTAAVRDVLADRPKWHCASTTGSTTTSCGAT